jgi:preprotein translocase subunit SecE
MIRCKDEKKSIIPAQLTKYVRDTKGEYKKIVWPTLPATVRNVGVVLAMCAITALIVCLADFGLLELLRLLQNIKL